MQLPVRMSPQQLTQGQLAIPMGKILPSRTTLGCVVVTTYHKSKCMLHMAQDTRGCSILVERCNLCRPMRVAGHILSEVLPEVAQLSRHPFAHQVVTTLLVTGSSVHCRQIAEKLSHEAASIANDVYGCGVIELTLLSRAGSELVVEGSKIPSIAQWQSLCFVSIRSWFSIPNGGSLENAQTSILVTHA